MPSQAEFSQKPINDRKSKMIECHTVLCRELPSRQLKSRQKWVSKDVGSCGCGEFVFEFRGGAKHLCASALFPCDLRLEDFMPQFVHVSI